MSIAGRGSDDTWAAPSRTNPTNPAAAPSPKVGRTSVEPPTALVRPGPELLPADSWESPASPVGADVATPAMLAITAEPESVAGSYHGQRRAGGPGPRVWLVLGLLLVALGALVAVPLALSRSGQDRVTLGAPATSSAPAAPATAGETVVGAEASIVPATGAVGATSPAPTRRAVAPNGSVASSSSRTRTFAALAPPMTLEAEGPNVTLAGSAYVSTYAAASNGSIVRNIGLWNGTPGRVRFDNVVIPVSGSYVLTFYTVHLDGEATRSAQIAVSGGSTVTQSFGSTAVCCAATTVTMVIAAGTHTITFDNTSGHAPSLDKMVIRRQ